MKPFRAIHCLSVLFTLLLLTGCATIQDKINLTEQRGTEKIFDYPYNKVFRACEDVAVRTGWQIQESNLDEGYIYIIQTYLLNTFDAGIKVKKLNDNKTLVKILYFSSPVKDFFSRLDALLSRDQ
jgi:hypothetical protein